MDQEPSIFAETDLDVIIPDDIEIVPDDDNNSEHAELSVRKCKNIVIFCKSSHILIEGFDLGGE
jgi:hypothetical protein